MPHKRARSDGGASHSDVSHRVLNSINRLLIKSAQQTDSKALTRSMLDELLLMSKSSSGFLAEADNLELEPAGMLILAMSEQQSSAQWSDTMRAEHERMLRGERVMPGAELLAQVQSRREPLLYQVDRDGPLNLPPGHPVITALLCAPLIQQGHLVGLVCLARAEPYPADAVRQIEPLLNACATLLSGIRCNGDRLALERLWAERKQVEIANDLNRAKDSFIANMSHEIRTPLNGIIGMSKILRGTQLNVDQREYLDTIEHCGTQLLAIVNDVLDYSRITSHKMVLQLEPLSVREAIEDSYEMIAMQAREKGLVLSFSVDPGVPHSIRADGKRLRQILINLLSNAVKFTEHGEIVTSVRARRLEQLYELEFAVRDTGIGIAAQNQGSVFDSFEQVENEHTRRNNGTGLGLTISRHLAELMGGRMWLESELGRGSVFRFTIAVEEFVDLEALRQTGSELFHGKRVLIVDDKAANRLVLFDLLLSWRMQPMLCSSSEEAMMYLRSSVSFDAAFIDIRMPSVLGTGDGEEGVRLAERMKAAGARFPLVALSSVGEKFDAPADLFAHRLSKPIREKRLFEACQAMFLGKVVVPQPVVPIVKKPEPLEHPLRILIAEDHMTNQKVIGSMLRGLGFAKFDMVSNGLEALKAIADAEQRGSPYQALLLDIRMPMVDGFQVAKEVCRRYGKSKRPFMIAVTASVLDQDREQCKQSGMSGYLPKPINQTELETMLLLIEETLANKDRNTPPSDLFFSQKAAHK